MTDQQIRQLITKYQAGTCTAQERALIMSWYNQVDQDNPLLETKTDLDQLESTIWTNALAIYESKKHKARSLQIYRWSVAAAAILLIIGVTYLFFPASHTSTTHIAKDIPAGSNKATLTLANGQRILLDSANNGTIAIQSNLAITKNKAGQLLYTVVSAPNHAPAVKDATTAFNTISTPNGGQYQVVLPDGSKVYLNAASSLKYPIHFATNERRVVLTGEGYFEVAKNPNQPFLVTSAGQTIKVLGTHFNVSGYAGEPTLTTLVEGKVVVSSLPVGTTNPSHTNQQVTLSPNQQAINTGTSLQTKVVNAADVIAWKDGLFVFTNTNLSAMLKQIARWYNVEVDYASLPNIAYDGEIPRNVGLLQVLKLIAAGSNVPLKLEERRITLQK